MNLMGKTKEVLAEILDVEKNVINGETYLVRDLNAESIDLLELAVSLNSAFQVEINDDEIFLTRLRRHILEAKDENQNLATYLKAKYTFLNDERVTEILQDLDDGPVTKVKDILSYIEYKRNEQCLSKK